MQLWKRLIEQHLQDQSDILENQFWFTLGQSTIEAIFLVRHWSRKEGKSHIGEGSRQDSDIVDSLNKENGIPNKYINVLQDNQTNISIFY